MWFAGSSARDIFTARSPVSEFIASSEMAIARSGRTYKGLAQEGKVDICTVQLELKNLLDIGAKLSRVGAPASQQRVIISKVMTSLASAYASLIAQTKGVTRSPPYAILLRGNPGIGKSTLKNAFAKVHAQVVGREWDERLVYYRNPVDPYWSGYCAGIPYIFINEPGSLNKNIAARQGDPVMLETLNIMSSEPLIATMAAVEDKGVHTIDPELVLLDTNSETLNLEVTTANPAANWRRFNIIIEPTVKPQYANDNGGKALDPNKVPDGEMDLWLFRGYYKVPKDPVNYTVVKAWDNTLTFSEVCTYLANDMKSHIIRTARHTLLQRDFDVTPYIDPEVLQSCRTAVTTDPVTGSATAFAVETAEEAEQALLPPDYQLPLTPAEMLALEALEEAKRQPTRGDLHLWLAIRSLWMCIYQSFWVVFYHMHVIESPPLPYKASVYFAASVESLQKAMIFKAIFWFGRTAWYALLLCVEIKAFAIAIFLCAMVESFVLARGIEVQRVSTFSLLFADSETVAAYVSRTTFSSYFANRRILLRQRFLTLCQAFGIAVELPIEPAVSPRFWHWQMISASLSTIGGMSYIAAQAAQIAKFSTEGLALSRQHTDITDSEYIRKFEEDVGAERPAPRKAVRMVRWPLDPQPIIVPERQHNSPEEIIASVRRNTRYIRVLGAAKPRYASCLGICNSFAVVNKHILGKPKDGIWEVSVAVDPFTVQHPTGIINMILSTSDVAYFESADLVLIRTSARFNDIRSLICEESPTLPYLGAQGWLCYRDVPVRFRVNSSPDINVKDGDETVLVSRVLAYSLLDHKQGFCGNALVLAQGNGAVVVGIHAAGDDNSPNALAQGFDMQLLSPAIEQLSSDFTFASEGAFHLPEQVKSLSPPHGSSPFCFETTPGVLFFGKMDGVPSSRPTHSHVTESPLIKEAESLTGVCPYDENGATIYGPPTMKAVISPEGEYCSPTNHFIRAVGVEKKALDPKIMDVTVDVISRRIIKGLQERGVVKMRPLPLDHAVNGDPEDDYLRSMGMSKSGGYGFPGPKRKHSVPASFDWKKQDAWKPNASVMAQVTEALEAYRKGECANFILGAQLKDEPRSREKIRKGKTRMFCMSPYHAVIINRIFLACIFTAMVEHGDLFCTSIGINMHGVDVDEFVTSLLDFSDLFMELDYAGFDTSMLLDVGYMVSRIIYAIVKAFGFNDLALTFVRGVLTDNLFPLVNLFNELFIAPGLQTSGKYGTAEDNSLRGLVLLVYAWVSMMTKYSPDANNPGFKCYEPDEFFDYVLARIYGDDLLCAIKREIAERFNNLTYRDFCRRVYGIEVTSARKDGEMEATITIHQASFLKRTFVYREDIGHWVARLERTSIMKSICFYIPSQHITPADQMHASCVSALRELFFYSDEESYDKLRHKFAEALERTYDFSPAAVLKTFPTFKALVADIYLSQDAGESKSL
jgi:hypothetical protein